MQKNRYLLLDSCTTNKNIKMQLIKALKKFGKRKLVAFSQAERFVMTSKARPEFKILPPITCAMGNRCFWHR